MENGYPEDYKSFLIYKNLSLPRFHPGSMAAFINIKDFYCYNPLPFQIAVGRRWAEKGKGVVGRL